MNTLKQSTQPLIHYQTIDFPLDGEEAGIFSDLLYTSKIKFEEMCGSSYDFGDLNLDNEPAGPR